MNKKKEDVESEDFFDEIVEGLKNYNPGQEQLDKGNSIAYGDDHGNIIQEDPDGRKTYVTLDKETGEIVKGEEVN